MMKKLPLLFLIPFLSLNCLLLQAQDGTFTNNNGTGDGNWSTATNWTGGITAGDTGIATLEASVDLETSSITVKEIVIGGSDITVSNGTLTIANTTNNNSIGNNVANTTTTFNCNLIFDTTKRIRNVATSTLVFASEKTVTFGSNNINLNNLSDTNPIEFHGSVSGTGTLGLRGRILLGSDSNFTGFIGTFNFAGNNAAKLIVNSTNNINSSITCEANASSEVLFNTNQNSIGNLSVTTALDLNFDSTVTAVQFSGTGTMTGVVDLKNYTSGVLKIGTTATTVSQTILDTWLVDGVEPADGTIIQDTDGSIIIPEFTSTTGTGINWEEATSWEGGVAPITATDNVYIQGSLIINSDVTVNNFTILTGGAVTVNPGKSLTVSGEAITSDNLFAESSATSFSSLIFNGTVTGEVGYNRWVHTTPSNDLISAPVPETFGDIEASLLANNTQRAFGPFDNDNGVYEIWNTDDNFSAPLIAGKGYRAARDTNNGLVLFKGEPVSPVDNVSITLTNGTNTTYGLWNLIGNPYPSYLDFDEFWTENSGQLNGGSGAYQAVYGYSGYADSSDNWTVWNNIETNNGYKITPGQGFFVKTTASGGTVTFTPAMRTTGSSDDFIEGRTATPNHVLSELFLSRESSQHSTKIYFVDNQTRGLDPGYDAAAFTGSSSPIYTHLVENNENIKFAIQALPYNDFNEVVVPLGVNAEAGTQLTIGMNPETVSIPETVTVYLEDNLTNTWTLLNNSDYVFTPSDALNGTGRFYVHFSATTLSTDDALINGLHIYSNQASKTVVIKGQLLADTTAVLYDMQGRSVFQQVLTSSNTTQTLNVSSLKAGVYIVALKTPTQNKTQKIIIK